MAAVDDCPTLHYRNGTRCVFCFKCINKKDLMRQLKEEWSKVRKENYFLRSGIFSKVPPKEVPSSTNDDSKVQTEDPTLAATTPSAKKPVLWIGVGVGSTVLAIIFAVALIRRKRNNQRKRDVNARDTTTRGEDTQQMTPVKFPQECGLDLPIKDLTIGGRRFIAKKLNGKYYDGYFYWQMTADKVGLRDECESWKNHADNPAEKFLTAYGEKEGSTIRNLIKALRDPEVDLTQIAKEIEDKFSPPQVQRQLVQPINQGGFELAESTYQGQLEDLTAQDEPAAGCVFYTEV